MLQWAADEGHVLLTHDVNTMTQEAYARIATAMPMPGVLIVSRALSIGQVVDEMELLVEGSLERVRHFF